MQVTYKKKIVKNLGNYESLSLEIGIEDVVDHEIENYQEACDRVRTMVNDNLKEEFERLRGGNA